MSGYALPSSALRASRSARRSGGPGWLGRLSGVLGAIESRRLLREMDDRMLSDIGIGRAEALREADRLPWDLSPSRRG